MVIKMFHMLSCAMSDLSSIFHKIHVSFSVNKPANMKAQLAPFDGGTSIRAPPYSKLSIHPSIIHPSCIHPLTIPPINHLSKVYCKYFAPSQDSIHPSIILPSLPPSPIHASYHPAIIYITIHIRNPSMNGSIIYSSDYPKINLIQSTHHPSYHPSIYISF